MEVSCGVELQPTQLRYVSLMLFFQPLYPKQIVRKKGSRIERLLITGEHLVISALYIY